MMPPDVKAKFKELQKQLDAIGPAAGRRGGGGVPAFWTVELDKDRLRETTYILTSGDPERPELKHPVAPGWPLAPEKLDFREGRLETFSDWLTAPENPLFARVAVNRLWQWHFGEGLMTSVSDFGALGGTPSNPAGTSGPWRARAAPVRKWSRSRPAAARMVASNSPCSAILRKRVPTLPRIGTTLRSGRASRICAQRRVLLLATVAPVGSDLMVRPGG